MQISFLSRDLAQDKTNYVGHDTLVLCPKKMTEWPREYQLYAALSVAKPRAANNQKIGAGCKQELKGHFANRTLSITYLTPTYSSHCHAREQSNYLNSPKTDTSKWKKKTLSVFKEKCRRPQWATPFWSWLLQSHSGFSVVHSGDLYVSLSDYCYFIHLTSGDVMDCHLFAGKALRSTSKQNKGRFMPERIQCTKDAQPVEIKGEPCFPLTDLSTQRLSKQRCKMKILIQKIN